MKKISAILGGLLLFAGIASAQALVSPEVDGGKVTFRIDANYATVVNVVGSWMQNPWGPGETMVKGDKGVWEYTIDAPAPEIYFYRFIVDGVPTIDMRNPFIQQDGPNVYSMLLIDGERSANYSEAGKHGTAAFRWYHSDILGMDRRMTVYTPCGYEQNTRQRYPVLYLLHGHGGDERAWTDMGRAVQILDNLIEKGLAKPMICVMPNGNPNEFAARTLANPVDGTDALTPSSLDTYVRSLCEEIVPFIDRNYRTVAKPDSRAIAGLSMGGAHTIMASAAHPEMFHYVCPLSAAGQVTPESAAALKKSGVKLYFLACGNTDFLYQNFLSNHQALTDGGLDHVFFQSEGGHTWDNWRLYLNTFAPLLFK